MLLLLTIEDAGESTKEALFSDHRHPNHISEICNSYNVMKAVQIGVHNKTLANM